MPFLLLGVVVAMFALGALTAHPTLAAPTVGVIADDLVDYTTWAAPHADLWTGAEVARILAEEGLEPHLLTAADLTLEGLARHDAVLIATDHTYPERGAWNGPVARALVEYVRRGGIYAMPIGVPHYISKDLDTGALDPGHWDDFFGFHASTSVGRGPLSLTRQGRELGLPDPAGLNAPPIRRLDFTRSAVLVWGANYVPCLTAVPFGEGWLIHWGGGEAMDRPVRDFLVRAQAAVILAAKEGRLRVLDRAQLMAEEGVAGKSLDDLDREAFRPAPSPLAGEPTLVALDADDAGEDLPPRPSLSLDGPWDLLGLPIGTGDARSLLAGQGWDEAIRAQVPCSVQAALFAAGRIPDPTVGFNDQIARGEVAEKEWWLRRRFSVPGDLLRAARTGGLRLVFDGVDYSASFFLNGVRLGEHEGPFGGPDFDVTGLVRERNTLIVRLDQLPPDWRLVFKTNCVYGWHYVNCPPLGIWRSVRLESVPEVEITDVFVAATDAQAGQVDLSVALRGPEQGFSCTLRGRLRPANFEGQAHRFSLPVQARGPQTVHHVRFTVPNPRLWWPNGLGEQPLYRLEVSAAEGDRLLDVRGARFGLRTIQMADLPGGPEPDRYRWTFVINGRPSFIKGTNWCTIDAFLRLDEPRYRRFLTLARDAHIQVLRSWGGGLLETDTFYDLCDELGILVWQEFPLTWQNFDVLRLAVADETATRNIRRLRNRPSLALWCGGNEHSGQGWLIELLGRRCLELDGTRAYHRTDPYGGSIHNYNVYWGLAPLEYNLGLGKQAPVIGEFGLASPCSVEGTLRFLPEAERDVWPPPDDGAFIHHTPTFTPKNMEHLNRYAQEVDPCRDLAGFTRGMQLAQATGLRGCLETMRTRWPAASAVVYYKLTDVYPGASWSTVDWYGIPKIPHYFVQDAYAPLHACALLEGFDVEVGQPLKAQLYVLDDREELGEGARVRVRLFDGELRLVAEKTLPVEGPAGRVRPLGGVEMGLSGAEKAPLLLVVDLESRGSGLDRTFYWLNFRASPGCLFALPRTTLAARHEGGELVIRNTGRLPAVGVHVQAPDCSDSLRLGDGHFWLDAGEERHVAVEVMPTVSGETHPPGKVTVAAWNAEGAAVDW